MKNSRRFVCLSLASWVILWFAGAAGETAAQTPASTAAGRWLQHGGWLGDCLRGAKDPESIRHAALHLRIAAPAAVWDDGIPLGNGLMGALLYGDGSQLKFSLDRSDLWDERPCPAIFEKNFTYAHWLALVKAGKWADLHRMSDRFAMGRQLTPTKIPGGRLELTLAPAQKVRAFSLDLSTAVGRAELENGKGPVECLLSASENVLLVRIPSPAPIRWGFVCPAVLQQKLGCPPPQAGENGDVRWFVQSLPDGPTYAMVGQQRATSDGTLIGVAVTATTTDGADPLAAGKRLVHQAVEAGYDRMLASHVEWWRKFWSVSQVFVPDELQLLHYNLACYYLGAASRPGAPAMGSKAVWTGNELPLWWGDYTSDLNTEMYYVSYPAAGHFEEGRSFFEFLWERLPAFRKFAHDFYGTPGAMLPAVMSLSGLPMDTWWVYSKMPQGNGSWVGWTFYRHWLYTRDADFLRTRAYPFCVELGECIAALLKPDANGILKVPMSSSPEIFDDTPKAYMPPNSNYDRDCMAALFGALADMAADLGKPKEAKRWHGIATHLGNRWFDPQTKGLGWALGMPLSQSHRHFSHLMSIHPLGQLTVEGSDLDREVISSSLADLDRLGTRKWMGFTQSWAACMHARAADGDAALKFMDTFCEYTTRAGFHANGNQKAGGSRVITFEGNFIGMEAIHEMLLQSWGGVVRLFPAMPARWTEAEFRDLRAEGGWKVSARRKDGRLASARIKAACDGLLRLRDNFAGRQPRFSRSEVRKIGENYECPLKAGDTLEVDFHP